MVKLVKLKGKPKTTKGKTSKHTTKMKTTKMKTTAKMHNEIKHKALKRKITRKAERKYVVERVINMTKLLPKFINFYKKLKPDEVLALKYYKGYGSNFQTKLLTNETKPIEITFPFTIDETKSFEYIINNGNIINPSIPSFDFKDIPIYIYNNYNARLNMLNKLDSIFIKPQCPRLTGNEVLFRGLVSYPSLKKCKAGDTHIFKNFMSSSLDRTIAEIYSNSDTMLVFTGMKDIPFIYTPNNGNDNISKSGSEYSKYASNTQIIFDLSECTLPRNLEFKINRIEDGKLGNYFFSKSNNKTTYNKLLNVLKNKGIFNSITKTKTMIKKPLEEKGEESEKEKDKDADVDVDEDKDEDADAEKDKKNDKNNEIIEQQIFPKIKIYYCSFVKWHPRKTLNCNDIMDDAKFVLDKTALEPWKNYNI